MKHYWVNVLNEQAKTNYMFRDANDDLRRQHHNNVVY